MTSMLKTPPSERPAFARKAASVKAAKASAEDAEKVLADVNRPAPHKNDQGDVHSTRPPPVRLGVRLLAKREVLAIVGTSYPTVWLWMRQGTFPRSRVVGGQSKWLSTEVEAWLAALPRRRLKGDVPTEDALADWNAGGEQGGAS
jgi:predicted DNA-binding transcriptional regulator AlpA